MRVKYIILTLIVWGYGIPAWSQADSVAVRMERIKAATIDSIRLKYADEIPGFLEHIEYGGYNPAQPVRFLGYKKCINAEVELFSWAVPLEKEQAFYNLFRFKDSRKSYLIKSLPGDKAPGWLFYDMVAFQSHKKTYFVLLGWSKTNNTNQKAVLIALFGEDDSVSYNHPLMRRGNSRSTLLTFEYMVDGSMMLKPDKKGKRIIFDHLSPADKKYEGYFMFYGPDASYDALVLKGGEWWYQEDVKGQK